MDIQKIVHNLFGNYMDYSDSIRTLFLQYSDGNLPIFHPYLLWSLLLLLSSLWYLKVPESTEMQKNMYINQITYY